MSDDNYHLKAFTGCSNLPNELLVIAAQNKLNRHQWMLYATELEQVMMPSIEDHLDYMPPNIDLAKMILMLRASTEEKMLALSLVIQRN